MRASRQVVPFAVLLFSLSLTAIAVYCAAENLRLQRESREREISRKLREGVTARIDEYVATLEQFRGFFGSGLHITQPAFEAYRHSFRDSRLNRGIQVLGFAERTSDGRVPIRFLWQASYSGLAIGSDLAGDAVRREALQLSRDTDDPMLTSRLFLPLEPTHSGPAGDPGFSLFVPIYHGSLAEGQIPTTLADRRRYLAGFVFAQFRASDFFDGLAPRLVDPEEAVAFAVYDGVEAIPETMMYFWEGAARWNHLVGGDALPLTLAGRTWMLYVRHGPGIVPLLPRVLPVVVALVGLVISLLLFKFTRLLQRTTENLEAQEAHMRLITDALPMLISYVDRNFRYQFLNRTYERWFGWNRDEVLGRRVVDMIDDDGAGPIVAQFERALAGERLTYERIAEIGGKTIPLRITYEPDRGSDGLVRGVVAIVENTTEERRLAGAMAEEARLIETFHRIGSVLTAELDLQRLLQVLTDITRDLSGAAFAAFYQFSSVPPKLLELHSLSGEAPATFIDSEGTATALASLFAERRVVRASDAASVEELWALKEGLAGTKSVLAVPLISRCGEVLGGLCFGSPKGNVFTEREQRLIEGIAGQAAIAIDNARLYRDSLRKEGQYRFLMEAGNLLSRSLDYEETLQTVVRLSLPELGEVCLAQVLQRDGSVQRTYSVAGEDDPWQAERARRVHSIIERLPNRFGDDTVFQEVIRTGQPKVLAEISDEVLRSVSVDEAHTAEMRAVAPKTSMVVPLLVGGRVLGTLSFVRFTPGKMYAEEDLQFAQQLAQQAALALENSRLYREAQDALRRQEQARLELQRSNAELEQFAYVASHDLKEPLRMVASYVQLLARRFGGELGDEGREFVRFAVEGVTRMRELIDDLLELSRIRTKARPFERVESRAVIEMAVENLRPTISDASADVEVGNLPPVDADPVQMIQLFQNLIGNGLKYRREVPPRIRIDARRADGVDGEDGWIFSVADNGIGIDREHFERIFVVFQRLHARGEYSGTGIGLSICKKIVERHGGRIWVDSEPGKGSTFYFRLPGVDGRLSH